jgi:hypothetical protein
MHGLVNQLLAELDGATTAILELHAQFANESGAYDELADYLKRRKR